VADNHFDLVQVWDQLGGAVRVRRNGTATVLDPATGQPLTVVENGVSTTVVHSDSAGRISFVAQQGTVKLVSGGMSMTATSAEAATAGAANAAAAQAAQTAAETARSQAQAAAAAPSDTAVAALLSDQRSISGRAVAKAASSGSMIAPTVAGRTTVTGVRSTTSAVTTFNSMSENILKVGSTYWMLYTTIVGGLSKLGLASSSSPEGPWTEYGVVLSCNVGDAGWETSNYTNGGHLLERDGTFYLFYCCDQTGGSIGVATATTVTGPYTKYGTALVTPASTGWDSLRVQEPSVTIAPDGTWVMAYMAEDKAFAQSTTEKVGIATAPGPFGPWTKAATNPVIGFGDTDAFDRGGAADPSLFYENGTWWCLYSGLFTGGAKPWRLGLAYATDPKGPWIRHPSNPILGTGAAGTFDEGTVWRGSIFKENGVYFMPYGGIPASLQGSDAKGGAARLVLSEENQGPSTSIWIPAQDITLTSTLATASLAPMPTIGYPMVWLMDGVTAEQLSVQLPQIPASWRYFKVRLWWAATTTGAGGVVFDSFRTPITAGAVLGSGQINAAGVNVGNTPGVVGQVVVADLIPPTARQSGAWHLRFNRAPANAADTYGTDVAVVAIELVKANVA